VADLGEAVLTLTVNKTAFEDGIDEAKRYIQTQLGGVVDETLKQPSAVKPPRAADRPGARGGVDPGLQQELRLAETLSSFRNKITLLEAEGLDVSRLRATLAKAEAAAIEGQAGAYSRQISLLKRLIGDERTRLSLQKRQAAEQKRVRERRAGVASNALIGFGFPLLFGQGIGAATGGGLGGAIGGLGGGQFGFAGSIIGTALGAAFDTALQKAQTLAQGLEDPIKNFDALKQSALLSSKAVEKYAQALIDTGRGAEAAVVIQQDLLNTFGSQQGVADYVNSVDELNRAWSKSTTILASFVAGPLSDFLKSLTTPTAGIGQAIRFEQLAGQLTPEQFRQVQQRRFDVTERSRQSRGGVSALLPPSTADEAKGYQEAIKYAEQLLGIDKQRAELAARLAYAQLLTKESLSDQYRLSAASAAGLDKELGGLRERIALQDRNRKLLELTPEERAQGSRNPKFLKIQQDTALEQYKITLETTRLDRERNNTLANTSIQLRNNLQLLSAQPGVYRETLRSIQGIQEGLRTAAQERERAFENVRLTQDMLGSTISVEDTQRLGQTLQIAANKFQLAFQEGKLKLEDAATKLRKDLTAAVLDFTRIRSDPQGLNRFLSGADRARRAQQDFQLLLPQFRQAQARFQELTGARAPEFSGTTEGVNAAIRDFIEATNREFEARQNLIGAQQSLEQVNQALYDINTQLVGATNALVAKDWVVSVNVVNQAGGASTVNAVNGLN